MKSKSNYSKVIEIILINKEMFCKKLRFESAVSNQNCLGDKPTLPQPGTGK